LHVVPHCALGQVGEGAEFIKTESFGHEPILTLKLFKSSVNNLIGAVNLIGVRATLISSIRGAKGKGGLPHTGVPEIVQPPFAFSPSDWKLMLL
jgi:hypothetical protein